MSCHRWASTYIYTSSATPRAARGERRAGKSISAPSPSGMIHRADLSSVRLSLAAESLTPLRTNTHLFKSGLRHMYEYYID